MTRSFNEAAFIALWNNHSVPVQRIAAAMGITRQGVSWRARSLGLPSRAKVRARKADPDLLRDMWLAGVASAEIARHFGMASGDSAATAARMLGLPRRKRGPSGRMNGGWLPTITVAEFFEMKLAERMRVAAIIEQAAMINAEMADKVSSGARVGLQHAKQLRQVAA